MERSVRMTGVILVLILSFSTVRGQAQGTPTDVAGEIDRAELSFTDALVAVDIPKLERLLPDDFTWTHTTGGVEMKKEYLQGVRDTRRYRGFKREGTIFRIYEKSALSSGTVRITVFTEDERGGRIINVRYTAVYVMQNGGSRPGTIPGFRSSRAARLSTATIHFGVLPSGSQD